MRRVKKVAASVIEHGAPAWDGREDAEAEEAQRVSRVDRAVALRYELMSLREPQRRMK